MMIKAQLPTEAGNEAIQAGKLGPVLEHFRQTASPEAMYFATEDGLRTLYAVIDMTDSATMPPLSEPLFMELGARVDFCPCMNGDDLQKGLAQLQ